MTKYVDAGKELVKMKYAWYPQDMDTTNAVGMYESFLKNAPAEDVAPVVHAHWNTTKDYHGYIWRCVCCNCKYDFINAVAWITEKELPNFCPNCGAKMDEE